MLAKSRHETNNFNFWCAPAKTNRFDCRYCFVTGLYRSLACKAATLPPYGDKVQSYSEEWVTPNCTVVKGVAESFLLRTISPLMTLDKLRPLYFRLAQPREKNNALLQTNATTSAVQAQYWKTEKLVQLEYKKKGIQFVTVCDYTYVTPYILSRPYILPEPFLTTPWRHTHTNFRSLWGIDFTITSNRVKAQMQSSITTS